MPQAPFNTVPAQNASFLADLQTFLKEEDGERFNEQFQTFVVSGGYLARFRDHL